MRSIMAMLRPKRADAGTLYSAIVAEARRPAWYREGGVADSLDGRFAVLSSLAALTILRMEDGFGEIRKLGDQRVEVLDQPVALFV